MDTHVGKLIDSVGSIFRGSDVLPWCDPDIIAVSLSFPPPFLCEITAASAAGCLPGRPVDECRQRPIRPFPSSAFLSLWWDAHEGPTNRHGVR